MKTKPSSKKIGEMTTAEIFDTLLAITEPGDRFLVSPLSNSECVVEGPSGKKIMKLEENKIYNTPASSVTPETLLAVIFISSFYKRTFFFRNEPKRFTDYFDRPGKAVL